MKIIGSNVDSGKPSGAAFELRSKFQPPLRMAGTRCAFVYAAAVTGQFDSCGVDPIFANSIGAAELNKANVVALSIADTNAPEVEATWTSFVGKCETTSAEEKGEDSERDIESIRAGGIKGVKRLFD